MRATFFYTGLASDEFYFIPTIKYEWKPCKCWTFTIRWGNLSIGMISLCNVGPAEKS